MIGLKLSYSESSASYGCSSKITERTYENITSTDSQFFDCFCSAEAEAFKKVPYIYMVIGEITESDSEFRHENASVECFHGFIDKQKAITMRNNLEKFDRLRFDLDYNHILRKKGALKVVNEWRKEHGFSEYVPANKQDTGFLHQMPFINDLGEEMFVPFPGHVFGENIHGLHIVKRELKKEDEEHFL